MFVGTFATIAWEVMGHPFGLAAILVAVPVSFLTLIVVSLLTQKENQMGCPVPMYGSPSGIILSALSLPLSVS